MTQRSSELSASREAAEDIAPPSGVPSEPNVITSSFGAKSTRTLEPNVSAKHADTEARVTTGEPGAAEVGARLQVLERQNRWMRYALLCLILIGGYAIFDKLFPEGVTVHKTMMESKELKLLDSDGNARMFLRMYSRVPVLQLMDTNGKPRISLGLRFDDTPFLDLSDKTGRTRATLEMTEQDSPTLQLFDDKGETTFKIQ